MKRSKLEIIGDLLQEIAQNPHLPPTRITARTGVTYTRLTELTSLNLTTIQPKTRKTNTITLTEKGRKYLQHYHALKQLTT